MIPSDRSPVADEKARSTADFIAVGCIVFLTLFVFAPAGRFQFVDYDYSLYAGNPHVQAGLSLEGLRWAFTTSIGGNWHPVTMLVLMAICQVFGNGPTPHHLASVFLHTANALLVFEIFRRTTGLSWRSALVALLFALHPLRVESVAWTSEFKDVLSAFFALLALLAYIESAMRRAVLWYALALVLFVLSIMSKASTVTLPVLMLLLDVWPLRRFTRLTRRDTIRVLAEKIPFAILAGAIAAITLSTFRTTLESSNAPLPVTYRMVMSLQAYLVYLEQTFLPFGLAPHYPYVPLDHPPIYAVVPLTILGAISFVATVQCARRPYLFAGWWWFIAAIAPVSGVLVVGTAFHADRYTYLAHVGLFAAIVWLAADAVAMRPILRVAAACAAIAVVIACIALAYVNVGYWRDNFTLYSHAARVVPGSALMHSGLAAAAMDRGRPELAEQEFQRALTLEPDLSNALVNYGLFLMQRNEMDAATANFERALKKQPAHAKALYSLAACRAWRGQKAEALELLKWAIVNDETLARLARDDAFFAPLKGTKEFVELTK